MWVRKKSVYAVLILCFTFLNIFLLLSVYSKVENCLSFCSSKCQYLTLVTDLTVKPQPICQTVYIKYIWIYETDYFRKNRNHIETSPQMLKLSATFSLQFHNTSFNTAQKEMNALVEKQKRNKCLKYLTRNDFKIRLMPHCNPTVHNSITATIYGQLNKDAKTVLTTVYGFVHLH